MAILLGWLLNEYFNMVHPKPNSGHHALRYALFWRLDQFQGHEDSEFS
jgi:hypothetical protein